MKGAFIYLSSLGLLIFTIPKVLPSTAPILGSEPYLIEVIIFSQEPTATDEKEFWEIDYPLSYPCNYLFLDKSGDKMDPTEEFIKYKDNPLFFNIKDQIDEYQYGLERETVFSDDINLGNERDNSNRSEPKHLLFLEEEYHDLIKIKEQLIYSRNYDVLFHESWYQTVTSDQIASAIVVDSPKNSVRWPEIQGTVNLFMNNFIHFKVDIWRNIEKSGSSNQARPKAPPILSDKKTRLEHQRISCLRGNAIIEPAITSYFTSPTDGMSDAANDLITNYDWAYAISMQATQKIKINQLNYLDHPFIGIILKVSDASQ